MTKVKVSRSQSASSTTGMTTSQTLAAICKESADSRRPSNYYAMREASAPPRVDVPTDPWRVSQDVNPPL